MCLRVCVRMTQAYLSSEQMAELRNAMDTASQQNTQNYDSLYPSYPHSPRDMPKQVVAKQVSRVASRCGGRGPSDTYTHTHTHTHTHHCQYAGVDSSRT